VKKSVVKKQITHEQYKATLFGAKQQWHGMNILRSEGHEIYGMHLNKISLDQPLFCGFFRYLGGLG